MKTIHTVSVGALAILIIVGIFALWVGFWAGAAMLAAMAFSYPLTWPQAAVVGILFAAVISAIRSRKND